MFYLQEKKNQSRLDKADKSEFVIARCSRACISVCARLSTMVCMGMWVLFMFGEVNAARPNFHDNGTLCFVPSCNVRGGVTPNQLCHCTCFA